MGLIRRIFVVVITMSIATIPAAAEALVSPSPAEVTMVDQADMPCCTCCDTQSDLKATACVLKCVALASAVLPAMTIAPWHIADGSPRTLVDDTLHGLTRAPPTPPPPA